MFRTTGAGGPAATATRRPGPAPAPRPSGEPAGCPPGPDGRTPAPASPGGAARRGRAWTEPGPGGRKAGMGGRGGSVRTRRVGPGAPLPGGRAGRRSRVKAPGAPGPGRAQRRRGRPPWSPPSAAHAGAKRGAPQAPASVAQCLEGLQGSLEGRSDGLGLRSPGTARLGGLGPVTCCPRAPPARGCGCEGRRGEVGCLGGGGCADPPASTSPSPSNLPAGPLSAGP